MDSIIARMLLVAKVLLVCWYVIPRVFWVRVLLYLIFGVATTQQLHSNYLECCYAVAKAF